ncbi:neutral zinc metallopeptidase [Synechococcus sp. CBW1107]|uniref:neutral zinc metallopeptidase n=1 Tax=Synechococcus sp. CBW1107 TaxID=2789857 RepID=UPI002103188D|nr:neutral zinc metallopeptidase [Synechococcus sp. CBW1107]
MPAPSSTQATRQRSSPEEHQLADFVSVVLDDTEDSWSEQFERIGAAYRPPKLVFVQ